MATSHGGQMARLAGFEPKGATSQGRQLALGKEELGSAPGTPAARPCLHLVSPARPSAGSDLQSRQVINTVVFF